MFDIDNTVISRAIYSTKQDERDLLFEQRDFPICFVPVCACCLFKFCHVALFRSNTTCVCFLLVSVNQIASFVEKKKTSPFVRITANFHSVVFNLILRIYTVSFSFFPQSKTLEMNESNDDNFDENSITRETFHLAPFSLELNISLKILF